MSSLISSRGIWCVGSDGSSSSCSSSVDHLFVDADDDE